MTHHHYGSIYAILSGVFFGFMGYFGLNVIHASVSVYCMLFWRFFISAVFLGIILIPVLHKIKKENKKDAIKVILYGAVFYSLSSVLYFIASQYIGSGLTMVIFFIYPAIVMFLELVVLKFSISRIYYLAVMIIFMGMICLIYGQEVKLDMLGISLALFSALLFAIYIILMRDNQTSPVLSTCMVCLGAALTCGLVATVNESFLIPTSLNVWVNLLGIGIICTALPIICLLKGLKHLGPVASSVLSVLEPVFVVVIGVWLLNEQISMQQIIGIIIILAGALISLLSSPASP